MTSLFSEYYSNELTEDFDSRWQCKKPLAPDLPKINPLRDSKEVQTIRQSLLASIAQSQEQLIETIQDWKSTFDMECKKTKEEVAEIFLDSRIGTPPDASKIRQWTEEGSIRYKLNQPPGFKDAEKKEGIPFHFNYEWISERVLTGHFGGICQLIRVRRSSQADNCVENVVQIACW